MRKPRWAGKWSRQTRRLRVMDYWWVAKDPISMLLKHPKVLLEVV